MIGFGTAWVMIGILTLRPSFPLLLGYWNFSKSVIQSTDLTPLQSIQAHFLKHDFYIPLENIFSTEDEHTPDIQKLCPKGLVMIWVPIKLKIPYWSEFQYRTCLKLL